MALSKLHLAIVAVAASGMLRIEYEHRIVIATPAAAEAAAAAASVCPDTDDVPFSADCLAFIDGGVLPDDLHSRWRTAATATATSPMTHRRIALHAPACPPSNENSPYSAECIEFLSGWYWQANQAENAP